MVNKNECTFVATATGARHLREQCFSCGWPLNQGVDAPAWLPPRWRSACHLDIATGRWNGQDCLWRGWFLFLGMYPGIRTKRPAPHDARAVPPDQRDVMVAGVPPIPPDGRLLAHRESPSSCLEQNGLGRFASCVPPQCSSWLPTMLGLPRGVRYPKTFCLASAKGSRCMTICGSPPWV